VTASRSGLRNERVIFGRLDSLSFIIMIILTRGWPQIEPVRRPRAQQRAAAGVRPLPTTAGEQHAMGPLHRGYGIAQRV